jgi:hypothetical protein
MSYAEQLERLQALRAQTRALEQQVDLQARSMQPLTLDDEREMSNIQSRLDQAYQAANRRAPPPLPMEKPSQFRHRLLDGLKVYHDDWRDKDLSRVNNATALDAIEGQLTEAACRNGPTFGLRPTEIKQIETSSGGGHRIISFVGGPEAHFSQQFGFPAFRAKFHSPETYHTMTKNNLLSKITERVPGWARSFVGLSG